VILASVILAEAAAVYEGREVVQTQSYGPEARGGASKADVIISDRPILYPKSRRLDVLVCLSQQAVDRYMAELKQGGIAIIDAFHVKECPLQSAVCLPFSETSRRELGRELFTNIVMLGALSRLTEAVELDSLKQAIARRVPPVFLDTNLRALAIGWDLAAPVSEGLERGSESRKEAGRVARP